MTTLLGIIKKYNEGQNIFRRESVAVLIERIRQLEKFVAEQSKQTKECPECGTTLPEHFAGCSRWPA